MKWLVAAALTLSFAACAQEQPHAPLPSQLLSAKKIFVGNTNSNLNFGRLVYDSVYRELQNWPNIQIVDRPSKAELAFQVGLRVENTSATNGTSFSHGFIHLEIVDVQTDIVLWSEDEPIEGAFREKTFERNVRRTSSSLVTRYRVLVGDLPATAIPPSANTQPTSEKKRFQKEAK